MLTGLIVGVLAALVIEVSFSIPFWLNGVSRPDLYYIELVLILIAMALPGLFSRSVLEGLLGGFIVFLVAFIPPLVLSLANLNYILNPLTPLFSSVDYSIPAFEVLVNLFPALGTYSFSTLKWWIWIIDLVLMFILVVLVILVATALIKSITIKRKKAKHWIGIPFLSIGLIIFVIFTPIIFSSTYGIIQASSSFLGGSAKMQLAYTTIADQGMSTQSLQDFTDLMAEANLMMGNAQLNFQGLRNIGLFNLMTIIPNQFSSFIEAGDQLALATMALTDIIIPLFNGIFDLTSSLSNATGSMADFGTSPSMILADFGNSGITKNDLADVEALKLKIIDAIDDLTDVETTLTDVLADLETGDLDVAFDGVNEALAQINITKLPKRLRDPISEVIDEVGGFKDQITGFSELLEYTTNQIEPTKRILWTAYNTIDGNENLKYNKFTDAKNAFQQGVNNVTGLTIGTYTSTVNLTGFVSDELAGDYSDLLNDLLGLMDPLLNEELNYATTLEEIDTVIFEFDDAPNLTFADYVNIKANMTSAITHANTTAVFGISANNELNYINNKINTSAYGPTFSVIGADLRDTLTKDFRPLEFGEITEQTTNAIWNFVLGCEAYALQNFAEDIGYLDAALGIIDHVQLDLISSDPQYLHDYFDIWEQAIEDIRTIMINNHDALSHPIGLGEIDIKINDLYNATDEKA